MPQLAPRGTRILAPGIGLIAGLGALSESASVKGQLNPAPCVPILVVPTPSFSGSSPCRGGPPNA